MAGLSKPQIFKLTCENSFPFYVKQFLKVVEPETKFTWNWHLDALCNACESVYYGEIQNLDINIPPRMLKSLIVTVLFPCWVWTKNPSTKLLCASRSADLSIKFNQQRRDLIRSEQHRAVWPIEIRDDMDKLNEFGNYHGGFMKAVSVSGKITGAGGDLLLSDDLLDAVDAFSRSKRDAANMWFSKAFYNRAQDKRTVKRININQRLHVNDISGNIASNHNFEKLILPMIKADANLSTTGFVDPRKTGEYLFPERYGEKEMEDDLKAQGIYGWSSQYQQSPKPLGGGIIKDEWIRRYSSPPNFSRKIITADLTFKGSSTSDYVCFQCWGISDGSKYLIDIVRGKWSYKETKDKFLRFCEKNPAPLKYIEDKANGPALISDFEKLIKGLVAWPKKGSPHYNIDKVQRVHLVSQDYEMGDVYFPEGIELVEECIEEILSFTEKGSSTPNDDMVDTMTMALIELKKSKSFFVG